jgi:predicted nuclease with TOPRIM domain
LLKTLPQNDERDGPDRRVSKAEVLVLAKRRITQLEREKKALEGEKEELEGDVEELKRRFVGMGGICMP